jgi:chromosome segregation ATPase
MTPDPADNSILGWLFGAGGGMAALAAAWKYIHDRRREATTEEQHDSAFAKIDSIADDLRAELKELTLRCDNFAQERNGYLVQVAELKAEVKHLEQNLTLARERISTLEGERNAARDLLTQLQAMYDKFKAENEDMHRQLARLRKDHDKPADQPAEEKPHVWGEGYESHG